MMRTKEEALEKIAELEKRVQEQSKFNMKIENQRLELVEKYEKEIKRLTEESNKYEQADKLIQTLRELLVPTVSFPLGAVVPNNGTAQQPVEATLVKTLTKVKVETAPPTHVTYSDDKLPGRILKVIAEGGAGQRWEGFQISQIISKRWGETTSSLVGMELKKFSEAGVLARDAQEKHTYYWIPEGVVLELEGKRA